MGVCLRSKKDLVSVIGRNDWVSCFGNGWTSWLVSVESISRSRTVSLIALIVSVRFIVSLGSTFPMISWFNPMWGIIFANFFRMRDELTIVCLGRFTGLLNLSFKLYTFIQYHNQLVKLYWAVNIFFRAVVAHFLLSTALRRYLILLGSAWKSSTSCGVIFVRYSTIWRRNSFSSCIWWQAMNLSKFRESNSDWRDNFLCGVLYLARNLSTTIW